MTRTASLVAALAATALLAGAATLHAAPEANPMADFFVGVLEIDVPGGDWSAKRYFAPDHTYRETGTDGEVKGAWAIEGDRICTTPSKALPGDRARKYCNLGLGQRLGDSWGDQDPVTGNTVLFRLTAGRN
jgi:hypothetical protein